MSASGGSCFSPTHLSYAESLENLEEWSQCDSQMMLGTPVVSDGLETRIAYQTPQMAVTWENQKGRHFVLLTEEDQYALPS